ncbi:MAG: SurA N-terminal domain-containing protein [Luteolibacter sp.]
MIENIRKYTGLMIVVFVLLFVSFLLLDTSSVQSIGGGGAVLRVDGKTYNEKEYRRLGQNGFELTQELIRSGNWDLYQFLIASTMDAADDDDSVEKFFITRIMLRAAADEFGLRPAETEISSHIRSLQAFTGPDGEFDPQAYATFIERRIGRLGMNEADVRTLVADILVFNKLNNVLGSGLAPMRDAIARIDAFDNQQITGVITHFTLAPFEAAVEPTDDDVIAFWENLRDAFTTEPQRRFTYIYAKPDMPADLSPEEEELPTFSFQDLALSEEERAERDAKYQADQAAKRAQERRTKQLENDTKINDFLFKLEQKQGEGFEQLAEDMGLEVKSTGLFIESEPPAELAAPLRQSARGETVVGQLFRMTTTVDPFSKISNPLAVGDATWVVARLDEVVPLRPKTFEEARDEARALFIEEKALDAMLEAAENATQIINQAIAEGKSFAEAVELAGLENAHSFQNINSAHQPDRDHEPQNLFEAARGVSPGSLADVITEGDRAFILFVEKRELVRSESDGPRIDGQLAQTTRANESTAFIAWMRSRTQAADVQQLYRRR